MNKRGFLDEESRPNDFYLDRELMDEHRAVFLNDTVSAMTIGTIIKQLVVLDEKSDADITLFVNTFGGEVYETLNLYDSIRRLRSTVHVVAQGKAMSAGALIVALCATGKRLAGRNTTFLLHQGSSFTAGKLSDMENDVKELKRLEDKLDAMLVKASKIKKAELKKVQAKDYYFDSKTALRLGIIDEVLQ
jgi:ATP-dependent Clp protease protease subunit